MGSTDVRGATPGLRGLVLEGVSGSGKTRALRRVAAQRPGRPGGTTLFLGEHYTERPLEREIAAGSLSEAAAVAWMERALAPVEALAGVASASGFAGRGGAEIEIWLERGLAGILAGLRARRAPPTPAPGAVDAWFARAAGLGLRHAILYVPEVQLADAVLSTRDHRGPGWAAFLARMGDDAAIVDFHLRWQRALMEIVAGRPGVIVLDAGPPEEVAAQLVAALG